MLKEVPSSRTCVLRYLLEDQAAKSPDRVFAVIDRASRDVETWTYGQTLERVRRSAAALQAAGIRKGHAVLCWTRAPEDSLTVWFALNHLGAAYVPINHHYRGSILERLIQGSASEFLIVDPEFLPQLHEVDGSSLESVIVTGRDPMAAGDLRALSFECLMSGIDGADVPDPDIRPWDLQSVMFTSGTTGPSKGALSSYVHLHGIVDEPYAFLTGDDRYLCNLPLFHVGGMLPVYSMLLRGGSIALSGPFRTAEFWGTVRRTGATAATMLSGMATLLLKRPPTPEDRGTSLRKALVIPFGEDARDVSDRFGLDVFTMYHMTEICAPLVSDRNPDRSALCGRPREGVSVRIVDEHDCEVAQGTFGELVVRCERPWAMSHGYVNNPEATAKTWLNGWFHTGDVFREDPDGNFIFVDRLKDVIRRRGENISSFEVETEFKTHPDIQDAAALAVPDRHGEDEVLVVVEPKAGCTIDEGAVIARVAGQLPRFMVPRYVCVMEQLPRTPTGKIQKNELRELIRTVAWWDRDAAQPGLPPTPVKDQEQSKSGVA
ncbi:AMP-binding protein [Microvirga tunisiensis]|uniref:AMP-binding protein n=1 Tax=Microvirga tunisiensis TaxID=2108360 RepID=A0A5N7MH56_9HYPH|nr:AMP-binding protein [Microvirga tunisiensis]MPR07818.1 AMP-binding protein [Microvirga tunisiensis]MPR26213.1 AMP-binding protein [Microvirga tunisiensis]